MVNHCEQGELLGVKSIGAMRPTDSASWRRTYDSASEMFRSCVVERGGLGGGIGVATDRCVCDKLSGIVKDIGSCASEEL